MAHCEDFYGRRCRFPISWFEVAEAELIGLDLVHQATEKGNIISERATVRVSSNPSGVSHFYVEEMYGRSLNIGIKDNLSYEEVPAQILDRQFCKLRTKVAGSVKVLWRNQFVEEATWEADEDMKKRYLHLFPCGETPNQYTNPL
ncbi:uncharacterized protein LOC125863639 [Solanum stenotomum]|uniref:uncharacterized protein LOC125863639 n=1 Tax=Solanum stenotomum TaxID=172797 RepID=UPI0020D0B056|nr:uncharacterized protein LOC125863639 [Solanum stenotomum]